MNGTFLHNAEFRGDLSTWDVSNVANMDQMLRGSGISDSGIGNWDVGSLVNAMSMFAGATKLSPELSLSGWNVDSAIYLQEMFRGSAIRDGGIGKWRLNLNANTRDMFADTKFEGDLYDWPGLQSLQAMIDVKATRGSTGFGQGRQARRPDALVAREFAKIARGRSASRREGACSVM
jgi:surface protein